jgi:hypothetical protein
VYRIVSPGFTLPLLHLSALDEQSAKAPMPFVPACWLAVVELPLGAGLPPVLPLLPLVLLEHAVSASARAATPASSAFPVWTLTGE